MGPAGGGPAHHPRRPKLAPLDLTATDGWGQHKDHSSGVRRCPRDVRDARRRPDGLGTPTDAAIRCRSQPCDALADTKNTGVFSGVRGVATSRPRHARGRYTIDRDLPCPCRTASGRSKIVSGRSRAPANCQRLRYGGARPLLRTGRVASALEDGARRHACSSVTRFRGPEVLDVVDLPSPVPGDGEQLSDVSSADVDSADTHRPLSCN